MILFELMSLDSAKKLPEFPQEAVTNFNDYDFGKNHQFMWWIESSLDKSWGEERYALVEIVDGKFSRVVKVDRQVEPEDATLSRDFSWVVDELNALAKKLADAR